MQASKQWVKDSGYNDRISFNDLSAHTVTLLKDRVDSIPDGKGGQIKGMKYLVKEGDTEKTIFTGSIGLVSKLAMCNENDVVTIQMYKANNKSYYKVTKTDGSELKTADEEANPVISDGETPPEKADW